MKWLSKARNGTEKAGCFTRDPNQITGKHLLLLFLAGTECGKTGFNRYEAARLLLNGLFWPDGYIFL
jgi:hypothetical protein